MRLERTWLIGEIGGEKKSVMMKYVRSRDVMLLVIVGISGLP